MLELLLEVDLFTDLRTLLQLALPSQLQTVLDRRELTVWVQLAWVTNQIFQNETRHNPQYGK
jgi:hypothetical protein